jgi:molybdopterin/thiamine biosynthesis adenylyltransferase
MSRLVFPAPLIEHFRAAMAATTFETCAIFFTHVATGDRLLVSSGELAPDEAYRVRTEVAAELSPEHVFEAVRRARKDEAGIVFVHSHPHQTHAPAFSHRDSAGEATLEAYLNARLPDHAHAALVVSQQGMTARRLATNETIEIEEIGSHVRYALPASEAGSSAYDEIYDRQVRAFGPAGQHILDCLTVALVGLGGTGSIIALELAYLGVRRFLLIDPQTLDTTNRNRVVGSRPDNVSMAKVEIAKRQILEINPAAVVETDASAMGVLDPACAGKLRGADFVFACTDSHASRAMVSKLCYQYLIPGIDVGVDINAPYGAVLAITGRTQMMSPGLPCLVCTDSISPDAIRKELMSPEQRVADPYFSAESEPRPAVISLNGTMCSLAVTMFLSATVGIPMEARYQRYDGIKGVVRRVVGSAASNCIVCSPLGILGRGDSRPISLQ